MKIECTIDDSMRMATMPMHTGMMIRFWLDDNRILTVRPLANGDAILVESFQAPGGRSYATALKLEPNSFNGIVIK